MKKYIEDEISRRQELIRKRLKLDNNEDLRLNYLRKNISIGPYCKKARTISNIGFQDHNNCKFLYRNEEEQLEYCLLYNEVILSSIKTCNENIFREDNWDCWKKSKEIEFLEEDDESFSKEYIGYEGSSIIRN